MTEYLTAELVRLPESGTKQSGERAIKVQFNPTTLKVARQGTQSKAGSSTKTQHVQYPSTEPATLSLELEFDTAEDYSADGVAEPVDVRTRTDPLRAFLEPPAGKPAGAPPRVRFQWGKFIFLGIVTQLSEEFDYFASNGTPLRAKVGLSILGQDPKLEAAAKGTGARKDEAATQPGGIPGPGPGRPAGLGGPLPGATPGRSGTASPISSVSAVAGESVQQLAARVGGNPAAWRSLMTGLTSPTGLAAGAPVVIGAELGESDGLGLATGFGAGAEASSLEALAGPLGLAAAVPGTGVTGSRPGTAGPTEPGFAVAAAGGISAATRLVLGRASSGAAAAARAAFEVPPGRPGDAAADGPDRRSLTYGRALPLRARAYVPTLDDVGAGGRRSVAARARPVEAPVTGGAAVPPWVRLPPGVTGRPAADAEQRRRDGRPRRIGRSAGGCR
jgi:hypothetical protein